ncbi:MAG: hypothetical protein K9W46_11800 [Candidatus Heimdallarchaeum endolithica]|uniref:Uncharacterized protein n=1 Tax=Candidatus Heimdallarchaeum endolithica TaxID=2876572 RepID=A0A9Y1BPY9_9ARCH|nr:MAG: hypothetical protein K9W46_11800 [Candidatus Heimdallarchaeum endolithica]
MFKKYKGETIYNYIPEYQPQVNVESPVFVKLPPDMKDPRLTDIEREIHQYWNIIHPLLREYIVMLARYIKQLGEGSDEIEHLRRSLDIETQNSTQLSEENRELKAQVSDLLIEKKALQEKVEDLMKSRPTISADEFNALKMLTSSNFDVSKDDLETLLKKAVQTVRESEEIKKAREERDKMRKELEEAKAHFEKTQQEVGETFQKRLLEAQRRIEELEEELAKYKQ